MAPGTNRWNVQQEQANLAAYEARRSALRTKSPCAKFRKNGLEEFIETAIQIVWIPEKMSVYPYQRYLCLNIRSARHVLHLTQLHLIGFVESAVDAHSPLLLTAAVRSVFDSAGASALRFLLKHIHWMANARMCLSRSESIF
jgi:hypothetical protein